MEPADPTRAAQDAVDGDRLLKGEDPRSPFPEDALHWIEVYEELVDFKVGLVRETRERAERMRPAAADEVLATDLPVLAAEYERLSNRLAFWRRRYAELLGRADPEAPS